jgi:hypothetical protein
MHEGVIPVSLPTEGLTSDHREEIATMIPKKQNKNRTAPKTTNKHSGTTSKPVVKPSKPCKIGRPTLYSKEKSDLICKLIASGQPLTKVCALENMPCMSTVMNWLWQEAPYREDFLERYARAREQQAEILADQIISIADDDSEDIIFAEGNDASGVTAIPKANREFIQRSNLRVEARKWVAAKLLPKKYGDKKEVKVDATITHEGGDELKQIIRDMGEKYGIGRK